MVGTLYYEQKEVEIISMTNLLLLLIYGNRVSAVCKYSLINYLQLGNLISIIDWTISFAEYKIRLIYNWNWKYPKLCLNYCHTYTKTIIKRIDRFISTWNNRVVRETFGNVC